MEKKLYRNEYNKVVAGVCSGLADYMHMDVTVIRILAVLLTIFGAGSGILIYIILWAIIPVNNNPASRMHEFNSYFNKQDPANFNASQQPFGDPASKWNTTNDAFGNDTYSDMFKKKDNTSRTIGGLILLVIGLYFLVRQFDLLPYWFSIRKLWPLLLVGVGLSFILKAKKDVNWENFKKEHKEKDPIVTPPPAEKETNEEQTS